MIGTARNRPIGAPKWLRRAAIAIFVMLVTGCGSDSRLNKPAELRIAYQQIPNGALIVKHNRWLEDALGIPVRWIRYSSGASVNQAVSNRQVDIGLAGSTAIAGGVPARLPYKVVWIHDIIGSAEALAVRDGAGIKAIKDLEGKRVAVPFGSTTHYALLEYLTRSHIDPNRVTIMDMEPADIVKAWDNGAIDAAYIWEPSLTELLNHGGTVLVNSRQLAQSGILTADLGFVSDELASDFPDVVRTWLEQENRAVELIQSDPAKAAQSIGAELGISAAQAEVEMKGYQFLTAKQQLSDKYLGKPGQPGHLIDQLTRAAVFQHDFPETVRFMKEKVYHPEPTSKQFEQAVDTSFITQVVK